MSDIYLGTRDKNGADIVVTHPLNRHALTVASSGSGKGACQILPNCIFWPNSLVVVDPKGEAAEFTAQNQGAKDQAEIAVLDPFHYADTPEHRFRFNPLDLVTDTDDIRMIANGLVMRSGYEKDPFWNDSAETIIAGILAFIVATCSPEEKHLGTLRDVFRTLQDPDESEAMLRLMRQTKGFGGLPIDAANRLSQGGQTINSILQNVETQTNWLSSETMHHFLKGGDGLDLRQLKRGKLKLFLVLPPNKLDTYGVFLRLFTRCAMSVMWEKLGTAQKGTPCLFLLDEFAALGKINEIRTAALQQGRSYGLHVWPFVISWGQLVELYGQDGAQDFLASSDAFCAFGIQDDQTAGLISKRIGNVTEADIRKEWQTTAKLIEQEEEQRARAAKAENDDANRWAEFKEGNRINAEIMRYNSAKSNYDQAQKFGVFGRMMAGDPPQQKQIVRPRTTNVTPQRPHELYVKLDALRARLGRPRIAAEQVRFRTAQKEAFPNVIMAGDMFVETPRSQTQLRPFPHFLRPKVICEGSEKVKDADFTLAEQLTDWLP